LDEEDLLPGQEWAQEIPRALKNSDFILIFLSRTSVARRGYVQREMKMALDAWEELPVGTIHTIPVRLDDCDVPEPFRRYHYANLLDPRGFDRLTQAIQTGLTQRPGFAPQSTLEPPPDPLPDRGRTLTSVKSIWNRYRKMVIALMFVGSLGLGLTFYGSWHRKKTGQAKCYDEVAVNSLVVSLQKATEAHERNLIDSVNLYTRRNQLLNVLNHLMAQGSNTETCISRELALLESVYEKGFINEVEWYENRQILWRKLHNLLLANVQSEEDREKALVIIKQLYDQGAINIVELHTTRQKLIEK
jgi:hypothetical protein